MPSNTLTPNEETSFEQGISDAKPLKVVSDAAKQQAKKVTSDIVAQLYGITDKSPEDGANDSKDPNQAKPAPVTPRPLPKLSGNSNVGDHAKFIARQHYLDKGDAKGAEKAMFHLQHYFDESVMTLEDRVKKVRQEQEREREQREKQEEEEEQKKKQEMEEKNNEIPRPIAKGRNRMGIGGKKGKVDMGLEMGKKKTETFRGASG